MVRTFLLNRPYPTAPFRRFIFTAAAGTSASRRPSVTARAGAIHRTISPGLMNCGRSPKQRSSLAVTMRPPGGRDRQDGLSESGANGRRPGGVRPVGRAEAWGSLRRNCVTTTPTRSLKRYRPRSPRTPPRALRVVACCLIIHTRIIYMTAITIPLCIRLAVR
jgi:hypothetical protein